MDVTPAKRLKRGFNESPKDVAEAVLEAAIQALFYGRATAIWVEPTTSSSQYFMPKPGVFSEAYILPDLLVEARHSLKSAGYRIGNEEGEPFKGDAWEPFSFSLPSKD